MRTSQGNFSLFLILVTRLQNAIIFTLVHRVVAAHTAAMLVARSTSLETLAVSLLTIRFLTLAPYNRRDYHPFCPLGLRFLFDFKLCQEYLSFWVARFVFTI